MGTVPISPVPVSAGSRSALQVAKRWGDLDDVRVGETLALLDRVLGTPWTLTC